jgi:L-fucose mutarotase
MILGAITHPDVLAALARAGHSSRVLVADAHFPGATLLGPSVPRVQLNFAPGLLGVADVLGPLAQAVPIEAAVGATHEDDSLPEIWADYKRLLPGVKIGTVRGSQLTTAFDPERLGLAILTGEMRPASCIVLTLGIRRTE